MGQVVDGDNSNVPLGGVLVIVTSAGGTPVYAMTNSSGNYAVYGLDGTKSDYIILAQKQGYVRQIRVDQTPDTGAGTEANFTLVHPAALFDLSGVITSDCDLTPPVANALVVVSSASETFSSSTSTDDSGVYSFHNLPQAADYRFVVVPGGNLQVYVNPSPMDVTDGSITEGAAVKDVILPCGSEISGAITWTGTGTASVLLYTEDNEFVDFTTVDATSGGAYTFTGLTSGNYKVLAVASGNTAQWYDGQAGIVDATPVSAGSPGIDIDLIQ